MLRQILTVVTTLAVMAGALFAIGFWRRSEDASWCEKTVMAGTVQGDTQPETDDLLERQRSACAVQRRHQRTIFGAFWRKGGTAMAQCGFELARLQMLYGYPEARRGILEPYGIDDPDFEGGSIEEQDQFIKACIAKGRHEAG